jgi:hypothetical protein
MSCAATCLVRYKATNIDDGGLQIQRLEDPKFDIGDVDYHVPATIKWEPPWSGYAKSVMGDAYYNFGNVARRCETNILNSLNGQHKFILPGAGDYICGNVSFNKRGDLLVNLSFAELVSPYIHSSGRSTR